MFCNDCGKQLPEGTKFCPGCGKKMGESAPVIATQKKPKINIADLVKKPWIPFVAGIVCCALVIGIVAGVLSLGGSARNGEGAGYGSARDAAVAYLEGMKAGDVNKMASCFAVESYVDHYDAEAYVDRIRAYIPSMAAPVEPVNAYFRDAKIGIRVGAVHQIIENQYLFLSGVSLKSEGKPIRVEEGEQFESGEELVEYFTKKDWLKNCAGMKIGKVRDIENCWDIGMINDSEAMQENYRKNMKENKKVFGCDAMEDLMVEITLDGEEYLVMLRVGRYGGKWYVVDANSTMAAILGLNSYNYGCIEKDEIF